MIPSYFNPSNDMALAANVRQYFPPRRIQQMETDLASLSRFWKEGPWGWSLATKEHYLRSGVDKAELPTDAWLEQVRTLSSREFACGYLQELLTSFSHPLLEGREMTFCRDIRAYGKQPLIFKSPWSSSGRGIIVADNGVTPEIETRLQGYLRTQGGFLMDRYYADKEQDLALEFWIHGPGNVEFLGYSLFQTDGHGTYGGNVVASQERIKSLIRADQSLLDSLIDYHRQHLGTIPYTGPVGIDMMTLAQGRIHPVVEINLRMNMGILALMLEQQGITEDQALTPTVEHGFQAVVRSGLLRIEYRP